MRKRMEIERRWRAADVRAQALSSVNPPGTHNGSLRDPAKFSGGAPNYTRLWESGGVIEGRGDHGTPEEEGTQPEKELPSTILNFYYANNMRFTQINYLITIQTPKSVSPHRCEVKNPLSLHNSHESRSLPLLGCLQQLQQIHRARSNTFHTSNAFPLPMTTQTCWETVARAR